MLDVLVDGLFNWQELYAIYIGIILSKLHVIICYHMYDQCKVVSISDFALICSIDHKTKIQIHISPLFEYMCSRENKTIHK